jgi:hypothetical protein
MSQDNISTNTHKVTRWRHWVGDLGGATTSRPIDVGYNDSTSQCNSLIGRKQIELVVDGNVINAVVW